MAKKIESNVAMVNPATFKPELNSTAISIVPVGNKLFSVVSVKFNLDTKESGEVTVLHADLDVYEARHRFKIEAVEADMF